jgi:hypothetical protein
MKLLMRALGFFSIFAGIALTIYGVSELAEHHSLAGSRYSPDYRDSFGAIIFIPIGIGMFFFGLNKFFGSNNDGD